jgi:pyruvate dehydrogenase E1 component beta subunit
VLLLEPQRLYRSVRGRLAGGDDPTLGARLRRAGDDLLLVGWGPTVHTCLAAAQQLEERYAVRSAVLDLRRLSPIDDEGLFEAAAARRRVVVVHEGVRTAGLGAEVVARLQEALAGTVSLPILRVTAPDTPYPPGRLEDHYLPSAAQVVAAGLRAVGES